MSDTNPAPPGRRTTELEGYVIGGVGVFLGWLVLAAGWVVGYATATAIGHWFGQPRPPLSWMGLTERIAVVAVVMFGMGGFLIEVLRFQGQPGEGSYFQAWRSAGPLRRRLFLILGAGAVALGLLVGRWGFTP